MSQGILFQDEYEMWVHVYPEDLCGTQFLKELFTSKKSRPIIYVLEIWHNKGVFGEDGGDKILHIIRNCIIPQEQSYCFFTSGNGSSGLGICRIPPNESHRLTALPGRRYFLYSSVSSRTDPIWVLAILSIIWNKLTYTSWIYQLNPRLDLGICLPMPSTWPLLSKVMLPFTFPLVSNVTACTRIQQL